MNCAIRHGLSRDTPEPQEVDLISPFTNEGSKAERDCLIQNPAIHRC